MPYFPHDGIEFHYRDEGAGLAFVFQHGLGNDVSQPFELYEPSARVRLLAFDCRDHGRTRSLENTASLSITSFADDLRAFLDHLGMRAAVIGGTSMGAAVAVNFALRHAERALGLVISRPAWLDMANPPNLRILATISGLLREHGSEIGREIFLKSDEFQSLLHESAAGADSVLNLFALPEPFVVASYLEQISASRPCSELVELEALKGPTLILVNQRDPIHPFEYGVRLAEHIRGSEIVQITPRAESAEAHVKDLRRAIDSFLNARMLTGTPGE